MEITCEKPCHTEWHYIIWLTHVCQHDLHSGAVSVRLQRTRCYLLGNGIFQLFFFGFKCQDCNFSQVSSSVYADNSSWLDTTCRNSLMWNSRPWRLPSAASSLKWSVNSSFLSHLLFMPCLMFIFFVWDRQKCLRTWSQYFPMVKYCIQSPPETIRMAKPIHFCLFFFAVD